MRAFRRVPCRGRAISQFVAISLMASALSWVALPAAFAQSREVFIGSTGPRDRVQGDFRGTAYPWDGRSTSQLTRSQTDRMLHDAYRELSDGRPLEARRILERIIEFYPQDPAADEARQVLVPIYASGAHGGARPPANGRASPLQPAALPAPPSMPPATVPKVETHVDQPWKTDIRRVRALDLDFRNNVGDRIFFGEASADIGARSRLLLEAQAAWLKRHPELSIAIEAHADDHGTTSFNEDLASRRAEAVRARLVEQGVGPEKIKLVALGRRQRVADCSDPDCSAQNRRAITLILAPDGLQPRASLETGR